ncbi:MAG TPA: site-specific integrase [Paenibacillus sp.]|jgi:integrase
MKYAIKHKMRLDNPCTGVVIPVKMLTVEEIENTTIEEKYLEKSEFTPPKTNASIRTLDLDESIMGLLESHKKKQAASKLINKNLFSDYHNKNFVATPHIFRHTHISMLAEAEVDLKTIMKRVGHDDADTTLKIYTHVTDKMKKNATEKIKNHFADILNFDSPQRM